MSPTARCREILEVARQVFSSGEYSAVTVREIAVRANVNSALVYYYFGSKERLVAAVIDNATTQAFELYDRRVAGIGDPKRALEEWFKVNAEFFGPLRQMARILIHYQGSTSRHSMIDAKVRTLYRRERHILRKCIRSGVELGIFKRRNPSIAAEFVSAHLDGICLVSIIRPWTDMPTFMRRQWTEIWGYLGCTTQTG